LQGSPRKEDVTYRSDAISTTVKVGLTGALFCTGEIAPDQRIGKYRESTLHPAQSFLAIPILDWREQEPHSAPPIGVFRVVNRTTEQVDRRRVVSFSWEDVERMHVVAEAMGFVAAVFAKADARVLEFERVMHGARSNIEAALQNLNLFTDRPNLLTVNDSRVEYAVPDSISHLEVLKAQIQRLESWEQRVALSTDRVRLFGDVLVKARNFVRRISRSFGVEFVKLTDLEEAGFASVPFVKGDPEALSLVFRNLFENALKYSDPHAHGCEIRLVLEVTPELVIVRVSDNGIGIDEVDRRWIFTEGFRGDRAVRRRVLGSGIGLSQSKGLMNLMNGDLVLENLRPTTLAVRILRWKDGE
jgi:signal transduction histidine kinase